MSSPKQPARKPRTTGARPVVAIRETETDLDVPFKLAASIFIALAIVYFGPAFFPGRGIFGTDYLAGGYQFLEFISGQLKQGHFPKWVPYVYGGVPLHANPGSAYYPTKLLLSLLLPESRMFAALLASQFAIAGIGMYLLVRELRARTWIAFVCGLAFMFTGISMSGVYSGHDGRIIVATIAPMAFYFAHRGMRTGAFNPFVGLAATLGFTLLCFQIQSNYYLLIALAAWTIFCAVRFREAGMQAMAIRMGKALLAVAFAFALSAVNFLPFTDYVAESPRGQAGGRGYEYATSFSMPPAETIGLAVPEQQGVLGTYHGKSFFKQHTEYVGALVLALLLLGFYFSRRSRYWAFFGATSLVALSMSYGGFTPLYRLYFNFLPGVNKFRAPSISFFLVSMSLVVMAGLTLEALARVRDGAPEADRAARRAGKSAANVSNESSYARYMTMGLMGVAILLLLVSQVIPSPVGEGLGWLRFGLFLGLFGFLLWKWVGMQISSRTLALALSVLTLLDLWVVTRKFFQTVEPPSEIYAADDVVQYLQSQNDHARVWVFPFGNAQSVYRGMEQIGDNRIPLRNYLMHFGIEQAGGEHGNQLERYNTFAGKGEQTYVDWHNFTSNPAMMSAANIKYIVSGVEIPMPPPDSTSPLQLQEVYRGPTTIVYRNNAALPRAFIVPAAQVIPNSDSALAFIKRPGWNPRAVAVVDRPLGVTLPSTPLLDSAVIVDNTSPDRVVVRTNTNQPALLVLSDVYAHGWKAWVDDKPIPIAITNVAFRGVPVGAGAHTVRFEFDPDDLTRGRVISAILAGLLIVYGIGYAVVGYRRRKTEPEPA